MKDGDAAGEVLETGVSDDISKVVTIEGVTLENPELSDDGKTLTLDAKMTDGDGAVDVKNAAVVVQPVKAKDADEKSEKYVGAMTYKDTVAPTVVDTEQLNENEFKINFSEPMSALDQNNFVFKDDKGVVIEQAVSGIIGDTKIENVTANKGDDSVTVNLKNIKAGKTVTVTIKDAKDVAGNLISPQPTTVELTKAELDGEKPEISSITQTGAKKFKVEFDKEVNVATLAKNITIDDNATKAIEALPNKDAAYSKEFEVTVTKNLKGLTTVKVVADKAVDRMGQKNEAIEELKTFTLDEEAPKATAKVVNHKGLEHIQLTFDKDVKVAAADNVKITGEYVKDYKTTSLGDGVTVKAFYADKKDKKVVLVPLSEEKLNVEGADYNIKINAIDKKLTSDADVNMEEVKVSFTRSKDEGTVNEEVPTIKDEESAVKQKDDNNNLVEVTFQVAKGYELDGKTAINVDNYKIADVVVEKATLAGKSDIANDETQTVTLTLAKGSSEFTGLRNVEISGVKVLDSTKTMETYKGQVKLNENEVPTIDEAKITGENEITLTFSEEIESVNDAAFLIKAGDTKLDLADSTPVSRDGKKVKISLKEKLDTTKTITIEPAKKDGKVDTSKFEVKDKAGNLLEAFDPMTVVKP